MKNYEEIALIGGSAKGRNNLNRNSSCRVNGLTFCWNNETLKYYRELLVDIEQQNTIEKERVSNSEGNKPDIEVRQDSFRFQELTTHDWDNYNQEHNKFVRNDPIPSNTSKIVNSTNLLDFEEEDEELGDSSWRPFKHFTK